MQRNYFIKKTMIALLSSVTTLTYIQAQTVLSGDHVVEGNLEVGDAIQEGGLTIRGETGNTASPGIKVTGDGGVVFKGTIGVGTIPAVGGGTRMMWYPGKAAFRVGEISSFVSSFWNDDMIGIGSVAFGYSMASGIVSTAMSGGLAFGNYSIAMSGGTASGNYSTAMSAGRAQGNYTTAIGASTKSYSFKSVVVGSANFSDPLESPDSWVPTDSIFIIGNGSGIPSDPPEARESNALVVRKNGDFEINGRIRMPRQGDILMGEFGNPEP